MLEAIGLDTVDFLVRGLDHPEGVAVDRRGVVYAGGEDGQLYRLGPDGSLDVVANTAGFNLGIAVDHLGTVFIADILSRAIWSWTESAGLTKFFESTARSSFLHPNAMAISQHGVYFSDSGGWLRGDGAIWLISPDQTGRIVSRGVNRYPNGLAVSLDGRWLYAVESNFGVVRLPIGAHGDLGAPEPVLTFKNEVPDGVAFSSSGDLFVSFYQPNMVGRLTSQGEWTVVLHDPFARVLAMPTNVCFLPDGRMVIANLGGWHLSVSTVSVA